MSMKLSLLSMSMLFCVSSSTYCTPSHTVLNWDTFMGTSGAGRTYEAWANVSAEFNPATLSVDISVTVPYIVESTQGRYTRPVTFVLDFEPFPLDGSRSIGAVNNCENREAASFFGKSFSEWWTFSDHPWLPGQVGNASTNMLYGPPGLWTQTVSGPANAHAVGAPCDPITITYTRSFPLTLLETCTRNDGNRAFLWEDTNREMFLEGFFDVAVISPRDTTFENLYNVYSLAHIPIRASFRKPAHLISQANVRNYGIEPMAVQFNGLSWVVQLSFITWAPRTVRFNLTGSTLFSPSLVGRPHVHGIIGVQEPTYRNPGDCMATSTFRCLQRTVVSVNVSDACPRGETINLSGTYGLQANMHCGSASLSATERAECAQYVAANPNGALTQDIGWALACDRVDYSGLLTGTLQFYETSDFLVAYATPPTYIVEVDTAFVQISLSGANPVSLEILEVQLVSVYLCTLKPGFDMNGMDGATGSGGCIDNPNVDNSPNDPFYILFLNGLLNNGLNFNVAQINTGGPSRVRFSFTVPTMLRSEFYVHAKVQVTLLNGTNPIRRLHESVSEHSTNRRRMQTSPSTTAFKNSQTKVSTARAPPQQTENPQNGLEIAIFVLSGVILCFGIFVAVWFIKKKMEAKKLEEEHSFVTGNTISGLQVKVNNTQPIPGQAVRLDSAKTPLTASPEKDENEYDNAKTFGIGGRRSMTREV